MAHTTNYTHRLQTVQSWLTSTGWTPDGIHNTSAIADRAMAEWYPTQRGRARQLVAKACRLLRGQAVSAGGPKRRLATFKVPVGITLIYERSALDLSVNEKALVTALSGNGSALELQLIRADGMTEILTIRYADADD